MRDRARRRRLATVAAALASLALAALAAASPVSALPDEPLQVTGSLTFLWQGDPARGCAAAGLCDVSGAMTIASAGGGSVVRAGGTVLPQLDLGLRTATVRVRRVDEQGNVQVCSDLPDLGVGTFALRSLRAHRETLRPLGESSSGSRCAGPLSGDLAALPLTLRVSGGPRSRFDLRGTRSFVAGPFSGELISTLIARPLTTAVFGFSVSSSSSSGSGSFTVGPGRRRLVESVDLRYRVAAAGALTSTLSGESDPGCQPTDTCGVSGSHSLALAGRPATVDLVGEQVVPRRLGRAAILRDVRAGRLELEGVAGPLPAAVEEKLSGPDGWTCDSRVPAGAFAVGFGTVSASRSGSSSLLTTLDPGGPAAEALRTYCPGPTGPDLFGGVFGNGASLASGSLPSGRLGARKLSVTVAVPAGTFAAAGWTGRRGGAITLTLSLQQIVARTRTEFR